MAAVYPLQPGEMPETYQGYLHWRHKTGVTISYNGFMAAWVDLQRSVSTPSANVGPSTPPLTIEEMLEYLARADAYVVHRVRVTTARIRRELYLTLNPGLSANVPCKGARKGNRMSDQRENTSTLAVGGAIVAAVLASTCCLLPLLLVTLGLSSAGISAAFEPLRPHFLAVTAVLLAAGFYFAYRPEQACDADGACAVEAPRRKRRNRAALWLATGAVGAFALFPNYSASLLVRARPAVAEEREERILTLAIDGMTCAGCALNVESALAAVPGVTGARVDYESKRASVTVNNTTPPSDAALIAAVANAGYAAQRVLSPVPKE